MTKIDFTLNLKKYDRKSKDLEVLQEALAARQAALSLREEERQLDALERIVSALRTLRDFSNYEDLEFRTLLVGLLFDLAEVHYQLKDYRQSEKELDSLFKVLEHLMKVDPERFSPYHILAMELSTRILRSRRKALDLLAKQQVNTGQLYEKVNAGVVAATDRLVDSLCNVASLLASSGDYKGAMKFYAEAIKISKKKAGRITRREVKMTVEMAEIMTRVKAMKPRAKRLLNAILPHAISLETIELEEKILAMLELMEGEKEQDQKWKVFLHKITQLGRRRKGSEEEEKPEEQESKEEDSKEEESKEEDSKSDSPS